MEDPDFDIHEYIMETGFKVFHGGTQENFLFIIREILRILNVKIFSQQELEDFNLLDHTDIDFVIEKIDDYKAKSLKTHLKSLLMEGSPFKLPYQNYYYCSSYSINRLSFLAGLNIQNLYLNKRHIPVESLLEGKVSEKFLFFLQQNFIAYFSSKIINPFRKCDLYGDLISKAKNPKSSAEEIKKLDLTFSILECSPFEESILLDLSLTQLHTSAKIIGYLMADSFYENFFKKSFENYGIVLNEVFSFDFSIKSYLDLKTKLLDEKDFKSQKKRFF